MTRKPGQSPIFGKKYYPILEPQSLVLFQERSPSIELKLTLKWNKSAKIVTFSICVLLFCEVFVENYESHVTRLLIESSHYIKQPCLPWVVMNFSIVQQRQAENSTDSLFNSSEHSCEIEITLWHTVFKFLLPFFRNHTQKFGAETTAFFCRTYFFKK